MGDQEEKKNCCESKGNCEQCTHGCCGNWRKCRMMKIIFGIIILTIVFHLGVQWGEVRGDFRGNSRFEKGGMMNWNYDNFGNKGIQQKEVGETTGQINQEDVTPMPSAVVPKQ